LGWRGAHLDVNRENADQVHARLAFAALAVGDRRVVDLLVLNHILGEGAASRLFQRLREQEGLTYDIWSGPVLRHQGGLLEIGWACAPAAFPDSLRLVREELGQLAGNLRGDEVAAAKEGLLRGFEMDFESPGGRCALDVGEVLERGRRFDPDLAKQELSGVTIDDVRTMAEKILRLEHMASAVCGPDGVAIRVA
jgi:predicted Zn-dependent peptidase